MKIALLRCTLLALLAFCLTRCEKSTEAFAAGGGSTKNGSLSRVITVGNYLYAVDDSRLKTVNASSPASLQVTDTKEVGTQLQTIFFYNGQLYIGSATTMYVYDVSANPARPAKTTEFVYPVLIEPRDPIIAFDSVIYSTVTSGAGGGSFRVFNNKDVRNPILVNNLPLPEPRGMDRVDSTLYLCDGRFGLRLFNIRQPYNPQLVATVDENNVLTGGMAQNDYYDVLAVPPLLFCYTAGALLHYSIANPRNPVFLRKLN
jgi:hypothetical protein